LDTKISASLFFITYCEKHHFMTRARGETHRDTFRFMCLQTSKHTAAAAGSNEGERKLSQEENSLAFLGGDPRHIRALFIAKRKI
jgi:hypothetical protein